MSEEERCIHDFLPGTCGICGERRPPRLKPGTFRRGTAYDPLPEVDTTITAKFDGICPECGERIFAGEDLITFTDDGTWVHSGC